MSTSRPRLSAPRQHATGRKRMSRLLRWPVRSFGITLPSEPGADVWDEICATLRVVAAVAHRTEVVDVVVPSLANVLRGVVAVVVPMLRYRLVVVQYEHAVLH